MRVRCDGAKCYVTEVETLASGAINYFTAKFTFDSAWADFITANQLYSVFEGSDTVIISSLVYNSETQTYDCNVPWQTLTQEGELLVGAVGHITTPESIILTTNMDFAYRVPKGAATNATTGSQPSGLLLDILETVEQVNDDADRAEAAVNHFPYIDPTTNNWFKWDVATGVFVDTGVSAIGPAAGFDTPTISVVQGAEGTQPQVAVTATGPDTAKVFDFDFTLPKGDTGATAEITIGTTETGAPGTNAQVTNSGDEHFAILNFTIPQGLKGDAGEDFFVLGHYDTLSALQAAVPSPNVGDGYSIGTVTPYNIYIFDGVLSAWRDYGTIQGPTGPAGADASIDIVRW